MKKINQQQFGILMHIVFQQMYMNSQLIGKTIDSIHHLIINIMPNLSEVVWMRVNDEIISPNIITPKTFNWQPEDDYEWDECPICGDLIPTHINCGCEVYP